MLILSLSLTFPYTMGKHRIVLQKYRQCYYKSKSDLSCYQNQQGSQTPLFRSRESVQSSTKVKISNMHDKLYMQC